MNVIQDKEFMQHFWDLAVDDAEVRMAAAAKVTANDIPSNYKSYTLKRLVKGLTSPRDSARLGFATALTQFLVNHQVDPQEVLTLIDEHTKVSGALKGFEERDNMFGKLFGIAALIRSGIAKDNELAVLELFKRLIDLHQRKAWMQELAVENLLSLLSSTKKSIQLKISPKLAELCASPLEEMSENELFLRIGLQSFAAQSKDVASAIYSTLSIDNDFSMDSLTTVKQALFRSAHKFPKVHRLWDYILGSVFAFGEDRELVSKSSLTDAEIAQVKALVEFLSNEMFPFSKEKRALGMKLCLKLLYLVPAYCLPNVFTEKFVRSLYIARVNTRSTLFEFAGGILSEVEVYAGENQQRILAILTLMAEYGYINFDKAANVKFVQHLMAKMDGESLTEFMKILCANIGDSNDAVVGEDDEADEDEDNNATGDDAVAENLLRRNRGVAAIFLFSEMGKFVQPALRSQQTPIMMSILTRLACFSSGETRKWSSLAAPATKKDKKTTKGGKKDKAAATPAVEVTPEMLVMDECIALLESTESVKVQGPSTEIQEQATVALLSLIHDTKSHLLFTPKQHHQPTNDAAADSQQKKAATQAEVRIFTLWSKAFAHFVASGLSNKHVDSERLTNESLQELSQGVASVLQWLEQHMEDDGSNKEAEHYKTENFLMALLSVIVLASIHALTCEEVDADIVTRTSGAALRLLLQLQKEAETAAAAAKKGDEDDEDDDEEEDPQLDLLDCSVEFLSVSSDHAIKGLRDAIKRMWSAIFALIPEESLSQTVMDVLVDVVMGNSNDDAAGEGDEEGDADDDEDDEDAGEGEEDEEEEAEEAPVVASKSKKAAAASAAGKKQPAASKKGETNEEDDDEKDVMIKNDDFMDFMMVDDGAFVDHVIEKKMTMDTDDADDDGDEDDDEEGAMVHRREADGALGNLIRMRKESRKEGLMALHRKQILLRSRVLDILEALINRVRSGPTLFSLLQPMVLGAKKSIKSKIMADINEGKTLLARILSLLAQLCKKKIVIQVASADGLEDEFVAELTEFRPVLHTMMLSKVLQIRQVAQDMIITLVRIAWASDSSAAQTIVAGIVEDLWQHFATKRHSTVPGKYLEDLLVQRFPAIFLPRFLPRLLQALIDTPLLYTKGEISEMLLSILKRFVNLETAAKDAMAAHVGATIEAFAKVFASLAQTATTSAAPSSSSSNKKEKSFSTKRVKPLVASVKSLVELLIRSNQKSTETANAEQTKKQQQKAQAEATTEKLFASLRVTQVQSLREGLSALSAALTSTLGKPLDELIALTQSLEETVRSKVKVMEPVVAPTTPAAKKGAAAKKSEKKDKAASSSTAMDEDEKETSSAAAAAVTKSAAKKTESKKRKASDVDEDDAAAVAEAAAATAAAAAAKTPASSKKNKKSKSS